MKRILLTITIILSLLTFVFISSGCIKKKNCDCGLTGKFVYFKEKKDLGTGKKVNAIFIPDVNDYGGTIFSIDGNIPRKYRATDTIKVSVCLEYAGPKYITQYIPLYKLKCIEKANN